LRPSLYRTSHWLCKLHMQYKANLSHGSSLQQKKKELYWTPNSLFSEWKTQLEFYSTWSKPTHHERHDFQSPFNGKHCSKKKQTMKILWVFVFAIERSILVTRRCLWHVLLQEDFPSSLSKYRHQFLWETSSKITKCQFTVMPLPHLFCFLRRQWRWSLVLESSTRTQETSMIILFCAYG